jgi:hypothetical protein
MAALLDVDPLNRRTPSPPPSEEWWARLRPPGKKKNQSKHEQGWRRWSKRTKPRHTSRTQTLTGEPSEFLISPPPTSDRPNPFCCFHKVFCVLQSKYFAHVFFYHMCFPLPHLLYHYYSVTRPPLLSHHATPLVESRTGCPDDGAPSDGKN